MINYREYSACGSHSQLYLVGGNGDAAFRCQYCSVLLLSTTMVLMVVVVVVVVFRGLRCCAVRMNYPRINWPVLLMLVRCVSELFVVWTKAEVGQMRRRRRRVDR